MSDTLCDKEQDLSRCVDLPRLCHNTTLDLKFHLIRIVHGEDILASGLSKAITWGYWKIAALPWRQSVM